MPLIVGNWKMHGTLQKAEQRARTIDVYAQTQGSGAMEIVLCPPATLLHSLHNVLQDSAVRLGGQDCHIATEGAHTGDISAVMLKNAGCAYVIVGHSERRADHGETSALVQQKAHAALEAGLTPIICVGETLQQRDQGQAEAVVAAQLAESLPPQSGDRVVVAYEPVWAIGTGRVPELADIQRMHGHIIALIPENVRLLYGGSVKPENAQEIMRLPEVHGVLVGGASLRSESFCGIIGAAGV